MATRTTRTLQETRDRRLSAFLTALFAVLLLIFLYYYNFSRSVESAPSVTTMLLNFGDNTDGNGEIEPANQLGSASSMEQTTTTETAAQAQVQTVEKVLVGTSKTTAVQKASTEPRKTTKPSNTQNTTQRKTVSTSKSTTTSQTKSQGDARGTAAIGNLLKGKGATTGSQGNSTTSGNAGDPVGGSGNGDSRIGVDRKLIGFIPGTMGRGGSQPSHDCDASGTITINYTVDQAGNVTSARRASGLSDPCITAVTVEWVKRYVKAERSTTTSTGSYRITF